ncbi:LysM peptidoglycan-binding domain-containing protein [Haloferula sargassicola]|uniref:LysM domain-containing protein n=1 Tax=Haloferula sargassicola TaxID=490096 RepID=A0ABP9UR46_9BACT
MRISPALLISGLLPLLFTSCQNGFSGENPSGTGPFDSSGNYVEAWADNPSKWNGRSVSPREPLAQNNPEPTPTATVRQVTPRPTPTSSSTTTVVSKPKPKPTPKPAPKPKPKPKPKATYLAYTVRKGDTLYGLAKRYGSTVAKIQKASGISGSNIRIGQKLKIPK